MDSYLHEPTAHTGDSPAKVISISTDGSPRWLAIVRDVAHIAACLCVVAAFLSAVYVTQRAGDALSDLDTGGTPSPAVCADPDLPWCVPND